MEKEDILEIVRVYRKELLEDREYAYEVSNLSAMYPIGKSIKMIDTIAELLEDM